MNFWSKKERDKIEPPAPVAPEPPREAAPVRPETHESKVITPFAAGTVIQGKLSFTVPVSIEGQLSGELFSSSRVIVGRGGGIDVRAEVESLEVMGTVKGKVRARTIIHVRPGGVLNADVDTPVLLIEEGGCFNGACRMPGIKLRSERNNVLEERIKLAG